VSSTIDANLLLYASNEASDLYEPAQRFVTRLAEGPEIVCIFWPTVMAYLRIATHPQIFPRPRSGAMAMANIQRLLARPHVRSPGEQDEFWQYYRTLTAESMPTGNLVPNAHIVALMRQNVVRTIWTRDRDFRKFDGIEARDPFD
jgi:toxin-antitoxin system PIN domain toxin